METLKTQDFKQAIQSGIAIVDFFAPWCRPCIAFGPIFEKFAKEYAGKAAFCKVNIDEESAIASEYGILSIPTLLVFEDGVEIDRKLGAMNEVDYRIWINKILR